MKIKGVKGTTDYYPKKYLIKKNIIDAFEDIYTLHNFSHIESPVIETLDLLCKKGGDEIKKQIFVLEEKGSEKLGLRFDMTVPFTRLFLHKQLELTKPVKWVSVGENFRYERPQAGRLRSFTQLNCELYGSKDIICDAELINMIIEVFNKLKLTNNDFTLKLNDRNLLQGILKDIVDENKISLIISIFDKYNKIGDENFISTLVKDNGFDENIAKGLLEIVKIKGKKEVIPRLEKLCHNEQAKQGLENIKNLIELVPVNYIDIDMSIARGLDYYTGIVFECFDNYGYFRALAGGGRYDNMIEQFGGQSTPACGFAIGTATLTLLLEKLNKIPEIKNNVDYYIVMLDNSINAKKLCMNICKKIKSKNESFDIEVMNRSMNKAFKYSENIGAKNIIIIGENEVKESKLTIKNVQTREQIETNLNDF